jgi:hypothetical protein
MIMNEKKYLVVGSGRIELPAILCRDDSVFMPTPTHIQHTFDDLMARMPTVVDIHASKHREARVERARAKRRKKK